MEKLLPILSEAQKSSNHRHIAKKLVSTIQSASDDEKIDLIEVILKGCLDQCLLSAKRNPAVDCMTKFLSKFISLLTDEAIFSTIFEHLLKRSKVLDKNVRLKACMIIASVISNISDGEGIAEDLLESIISTLVPRLTDKLPAVRVAAIKALYLLVDAEKDKDIIIDQLTRLMVEDTSKDVRVAAVEHICLTKHTLPTLIARIRDIKPEVRIAVCKRLAKVVSIKQLNSSSISLIVQHGLNDRDSAVKKATTDLVLHWLSSMENNVPKLLRLLDLEAHEDEAELLGSSILEAADKRSESVTSELHLAIRSDCPKWDNGVASLRPSEILWVQLRCDYARKNYTPLAALETLDSLMPDMVKLCGLLEEAHKPILCVNTRYQYTVRYLLRMTTFLDTSDVCGAKELARVCAAMLSDVNLPDILIEPVLNSWSLGSSFTSTTEAIAAAVAISKTVRGKPVGVDADDDDDEEEDVAMDGFEGGDVPVEKATLRAMRSLQVIAWSLQQNIGSRGTARGSELYREVIPFVEQNLQQPHTDLRSLSVRCLGLLSLLSDEYCRSFVDIIFQVARNDIEDGLIRCQALEALVDMATVYERFKDDSALTQFLLRLQEGAEPALLRVGAESAAKLLFSGRLSEPRLFANCLKFFFLPNLANGESYDGEQTGVGTDTGGDANREQSDNAYFGSSARLQQILSVFFQAFFFAGDGREQIAFDCISDLVADVAMLVRDREVDANALGKVCNHLLALCDNIRPIQPSSASTTTSKSATTSATTSTKAEVVEAARNAVRMRLTAAISREMLKLGDSKVEAAAAKEFVKVLGTLMPSAWIHAGLAPTVRQLMEVLVATCKLDKTSQKCIDKYFAACDAAPAAPVAPLIAAITTAAASTANVVVTTDIPATTESSSADSAAHADDVESRDKFFSLSPGLADLMALLIDTDEVVATATTSNTTSKLQAVAGKKKKAASTSSVNNKTKKAKKSHGKGRGADSSDDEEEDDDVSDDDEESEDEDEDEAEPTPVKAKPTKTSTNMNTGSSIPRPSALPSRSSKLAAASKIAKQLADDHTLDLPLPLPKKKRLSDENENERSMDKIDLENLHINIIDNK